MKKILPPETVLVLSKKDKELLIAILDSFQEAIDQNPDSNGYDDCYIFSHKMGKLLKASS